MNFSHYWELVRVMVQNICQHLLAVVRDSLDFACQFLENEETLKIVSTSVKLIILFNSFHANASFYTP